MIEPASIDDAAGLPPLFADWFARRGWQPRAHQLALLDAARGGRSVLLIAPTGGGKTLAGFLPSLIALSGRPKARRGGMRASRLHTLYISPLKALAVDIARNLEQPIAEMGLDIRLETRTGDTPASRRQRQRLDPPDMLMTTPEQLALMLSHKDAAVLFGNLQTVILDELHALVTSKRGDLLALGLARLRTLAPSLRTIGMSATVAEPEALQAYLVAQEPGDPPRLAELIDAGPGIAPQI
ncbi:MAG TPA: DEAD/DEAH box helicase, partial [Hyphomicrobiales bacterium]|nr:DEAD/DEAH box helicase [Hyphomicrobiales bacterium]